jgi:hypothetical protein
VYTGQGGEEKNDRRKREMKEAKRSRKGKRERERERKKGNPAQLYPLKESDVS